MGNLQIWRDRNVPRSLLDDVWGLFDDSDSFDRSARWPRFRNEANFLSVACDIREAKDQFLLSFDMPGLHKDDIQIEVKGNQLTVSGERSYEEKEEDEHVYRRERGCGKFHRSFDLPEGVDLESIEAGYENGVLRIAIPKGEESKSRKIKVADSTKGFLKKLTSKTQPQAKAVNS